MIVAAAISIIGIPGYRSLWRVSPQEAELAVITALGVIVFDVLVGVLLAVSRSIVIALGRIARPHDAVLGDRPELDGWVELDVHPGARTVPGLLVYRFDAPLFFPNTERFRTRVLDALEANPGDENWLVLDFEGIGALDASALDGLADLMDQLEGTGVGQVAVARANHHVLGACAGSTCRHPRGPC